ncbi:uncharacterized protein LOC133350161 isoform X1 [Lethenteron reissneri]|uniref:uncharacterized protein LOC133350161 isoform X1 n=1 Tax=Lethenteron reissneri TaxID=7753 RepID=UPI002AB71DBF|nr:uncharacterized protein LOC133350161 isoform X1 [Lethenteron reissneri]
MNLPLRLLILLLSTTTSSSISCTTSTTSTNACNITSSTNGREMKPLPRPQNVTLTGRNFFFKLKWQAPADCENCTYEARWQHYGSNCCNTEDCSPGNVAGATSCNLSISQDMLVDKIIVDVRTTSTQLDSSSAWVQIRCLPRNVVELDAPRVTLFKEGDSLRLAITPPELRHLDGENVVLDTYKAVITAAGEQNHNEEVEFQGSEFTFPVNGSIFWTLSKPRLCVRVHAVVTIGSWEKETGRSTEECVQFSREELNTLLLVQLLLLLIFIMLVTAVGYYFTMQYLHVANDRLPFVLADLLPDEGSDKHPAPESHHGPPAARPCHEPDSHPVSVVAVVDCPRSGYDRVAIRAVAHDGSPSEGFPAQRRRRPPTPPAVATEGRERWWQEEVDDEVDEEERLPASQAPSLDEVPLGGFGAGATLVADAEGHRLADAAYSGVAMPLLEVAGGGGSSSSSGNSERLYRGSDADADDDDDCPGVSLMSRLAAPGDYGIDAGWLLGEAAAGGEWQPVALQLSDISSLFAPA